MRHTVAVPATPDALAPLQRRTVRTLAASQTLGAIGQLAGVAVATLLAEELSGSEEYAGLGGTFQTLGSALAAVLLARIASRRGRRAALVTGYALGVIGAVGTVAAAVTGSFTLLLASALLFGGATASNNAARYAATDLATPEHRGRDLSTVVWATTIGAVAGPNLVGPGGRVAELLGLPPLSGTFVFSIVGFALAIGALTALLRPDPLLEARSLALATGGPAHVHGSFASGLRAIGAHPAALLGLIVVAIGHAVMVSVMVMTPLHMKHGHASLSVVGFVISIHVLGMFAFSPLVGRAVDRLGGRTVALVGSAILLAATLLAASTDPGASHLLELALFLLGLGWSCTLVSGSTLLTGALPTSDAPAAQGVSDAAMGVAGGGGAALAGVVVAQAGYSALALGAAVLAALVAVAVGIVRV